MKLTELEPKWLTIIDAKTFKTSKRKKMPKKVDGVLFLCPKCFVDNEGSVGTHSIICWQPHVDQSFEPKPGRWSFIGSTFDDLTLKAGSSSILLTGEGCQAHFFITAGEIK